MGAVFAAALLLQAVVLGWVMPSGGGPGGRTDEPGERWTDGVCGVAVERESGVMLRAGLGGSGATGAVLLASTAGGAGGVSAGPGWLVDTSGFTERWRCGEWSRGLGWLHIASDAGIWGAYMAIPVVLGYFVVRGRTPLPLVTWLFVAFIALCGIGHLLEALMFWTPVYRLTGVWKLLTALVSWATVAALVPMVPRVMKWPTLTEVNAQLEQEIARRKDVESRLRDAIRNLEEVNELHRFQQRALDEHAIVAVTDNRGRIIYVNDLFCIISGYSEAELVGKDHRVINSGHHPKRFFTEMYRTIASGEVWRGNICNRAKDGRRYWVKTTIVPRLNADGSVHQYIAIRDDITALKETEDRLKKLVSELKSRTRDLHEVNTELEQFVYAASHDLKSPLVTILGFTSHLHREIEKGNHKEAIEQAGRIKRAATRMARLIDDLLELSRVGRTSGPTESVDLRRVLGDVLEGLEHQCKAAGVVVEDRLEVATVRGHRVRVEQVVQNLVSNALKYGCEGASPRIEVGSAMAGDEVRVFVRDFGRGIGREHHERVFNLFQRLESGGEGTGVGLAVVKRIAGLYGGRAWVESEPGKGSTFWVSFLAAGAEAGSVEADDGIDRRGEADSLSADRG